jgi:DNA polymerase III subunit beta
LVDAINSIAVEEGLAMKIIVSREKLVESSNHVMKAVSSRTTIPILTGVKIVATSEGLSLTGSDSDITIQAHIPAEENGIENVQVIKPGSIVLQARYFAEIVKKLPADEVTIEVDSRLITKIAAGQSEFNLNGIDAEEYPRLPVLRTENTIPIRKTILKHIIRQTVFAVSTQETRPVLTGANWTIKDSTLTCVATDSHRLAKRSISLEIDNSVQFNNIVIPGKSLNELGKILDDNNNDWVDIVVTENQILFKTNHIQFYSRLLEGNYPETDFLIPSDVKTEVVLKTKDLLQAIDRASLLAREERNNLVKLKTMDKNHLEILSQSPEVGRVYENVEANSVTGEELRISFSAKYMIEALSRVDSQEISIMFTGAMKPFILRPTEDQDLLMLILPVRTN